MKTKDANIAADFCKDVLDGLSRSDKKLSSKYFYDATGDRLFQEIMALPEYYPTRCELEIFRCRTADLAQEILVPQTSFDLIELGAGDATKSLYLLKWLQRADADFTYLPVDISANILRILEKKLKAELPDLKLHSFRGEYLKELQAACKFSDRRKVVLFLGGNIGNMMPEEALRFCTEAGKVLTKGDLLIIGFDLRKDPHTILAAYNDAQGVTAAFNLNLLKRINRELGGDFNLDKFSHYPCYDPLSGACKSFLVSAEKQWVHIGDQKFFLDENEVIHTEISQKYSENEINMLAENSGFHIAKELADSRNWFVDSVWIVK